MININIDTNTNANMNTNTKVQITKYKIMSQNTKYKMQLTKCKPSEVGKEGLGLCPLADGNPMAGLQTA